MLSTRRFTVLRLCGPGRPGHSYRCPVAFYNHALVRPVLHITPANGGKDLGVAAMLERLGIDASEAIAFGDGENDLSMFSAAGKSVAMGNAQDTVKAAATYVTTAVDDDGIYNAAKHFGLL